MSSAVANRRMLRRLFSGVAPRLSAMPAAGEGTIGTAAQLLAFSAGLMDPRAPRRTLYVAAKGATRLGETVRASGLEGQDSAVDALFTTETTFVAGGNQPTCGPLVR